MKNIDTDNLLQLFGEDKRIKEDAPVEYKFISHLTEIYNTDRLISMINEYINVHPKIIDMKITDITEIILKHSVKSTDALQEDIQRLIDESNDTLRKLEDIKKNGKPD